MVKKTGGTNFLKSFLKSLAKLPSHYCRKNSTRLYLEPIFKSMGELYGIYKDTCNEEERKTGRKLNELVLSRYSFDKVFNSENLSIFQPKRQVRLVFVV